MKKFFLITVALGFALSGTAFGAYGEGYLRFSVANSLENLNKALARIEGWTAKNL